MGLQDEYLRNFTVLLTEKGVVPLTDPLQIAVYNSLSGGTKRPSDLAAELGIPSSSLHFVLDKMVDNGIIIRAKPDPGKKSVYYSNLALKIAGSFEPNEAAKEEAEFTFDDPARYYSGMSSVANMLDTYTSEIGLDMDQMRADYASDLADAFRFRIGKHPFEEAILEIREVFAETTGFRFSVFSLNPLTLVFEGDHVMHSKMDMMTNFVIRAVENSTERSYGVTSLEDFSNDEITRMKVSFDRVEKAREPYFNMSLPQTSEVDRFMMVELDGSAGIMTSDVQIDIVDAVYERPLCITDIVNHVDAPRSTITSNLLRLVEEGVISVFYAESGSAYYGLSCSILMKKARHVNRDRSEINEILEGVTDKPGSFMEGYLLYTLAKLKNLGFDTEYLMVVLGAKYMRAAGRTGPKDFDNFFGKMSDISKSIGLSLNVVSVYPLTIGIVNDNPESEMSPAMTFVKGMAHQGLEMASNGIFVRSSEEEKISFREIYPALSMTPVEGIRVEQLAEAAPAKKKRTSSVKTALMNRSAKEAGKPARTVRYITGVVMLTLMAAVLVFSAAGGDNVAADSYELDLSPDSDVCLYDENGVQVSMPIVIEADATLKFYASGLQDGQVLGTVEKGLATPLKALENGFFEITVTDDTVLEELTPVVLPETTGYTAYLYCFDNRVSEKTAYNFTGYIDALDYGNSTGGLYVNDDAYVMLDSDESYFYTDAGVRDTFYWQKIVTSETDLGYVKVAALPDHSVTISFEGDYVVDGKYVTGDLRVGMYRQITGQLMNDGSSTVTCTKETGKTSNIELTEGKFRLYTTNEDLTIRYIQGIL